MLLFGGQRKKAEGGGRAEGKGFYSISLRVLFHVQSLIYWIAHQHLRNQSQVKVRCHDNRMCSVLLGIFVILLLVRA